MNKATISADIISSTALSEEQRLILMKELSELLSILEKSYGQEVFWARIIKGDYIECVLKQPQLALRIALLIKSYVKSLNINFNNETNKKIEDFKEYGVRVAIGIGELSIFDKDNGIIDGEAIYLSGRAVNEMSSLGSKIKNTLAFRSTNEDWNNLFLPVFNLLDGLFAKYKKAQSRIVFYKLLGKTEKEISEILKISQPTINQHSTATNWHSVEGVVDYFERTIK